MESSSITSVLPLTLVAILAGGALYPHVAEFAGGTSPSAPTSDSRAPSRSGGPSVAIPAPRPSGTRHSQSVLPLAGFGSQDDDVTTAVDLLAEYYGLDITSDRLRDIVEDAATGLDGSQGTAEASPDRKALPSAIDVLEIFLGLDLHDHGLNPSLADAKNAIARLAGRAPALEAKSFRSDRKTVRAFVKGYFDDEALHDDANAVTQLKGKSDRDIDQRRLRAKDFALVDRTRLAEKIISSWALNDIVTFLIATVPDPLDSQEAWLFDPNVAAVRQGVEDSGFLFDRAFFPDTQPEPKAGSGDPNRHSRHQHWPGVVLFRAKPGKGGARAAAAESDLLVTFLVYETPTAGIHVEAFQRAADVALGWPETNSSLRVLGPSFSGSSPSLSLAIKNVLAAHQGLRTVRVVSGAATNLTNKAVIEQKDPRVRFKATVLPNDFMDAAIRSFLEAKGAGPIATLVESGTSFGATMTQVQRPRGADDPTVFLFPYGISKLRSDSARQFSVAGAPSLALTSRPLALEDLPVGSEQFPIVTPSSTSPIVELSLTALLESIRRERFGAIGIAATDERDVLFLANKIRFYVPNTLLYANWDSLLFSHPDALASTTGLIEASPYPMHPSAHHWPLADGRWLACDNRHVQFSSMTTEGVYNAAIALLDYEPDENPAKDENLARRFEGSRDAPPFPSDYVVGSGRSSPLAWISVASRGAAWPVQAYSMDSLQSRLDTEAKSTGFDYVFHPSIDESASRKLNTAAPDSRVFPSAIAREIAVALVVGTIAVILWGGWRWDAYSFATLRALTLAAFGLLLVSGTTGFVWLRATVMSGLDTMLGVLVGLGSWCLLGFVGVCSFYMWKSWPRRNGDAGSSRPWVVVGFLLIGCLASLLRGLWNAGPSAMFTQRALDISSGVSPLVTVVIIGSLPCLMAVCEFLRLKTVGDERERWLDTGRLWKDSGRRLLISLTGGEAAGGLGTSGDDIFLIRTSLFGLRKPAFWIVGLMTALMWATLFAGPPLVISVEGKAFGLAVAAFLLLAQGTLTVAAIQHFCLWRACERLLHRMTWEPLRSAYHRLGLDNRMATQDFVSLPVSLLDLQPMVDLAKDPSLAVALYGSIDEAWSRDVMKDKYWLDSDTWKELSEFVGKRPRDGSEYSIFPAGVVGTVAPDDARVRLAAMASLLLIRDILARLAQTRVLAGGCLFLLIALYVSFTFQASHSLLTVIWFDGLVIVALMIGVFVRMEQNEILSLTRNTKPGTLDWNVETVTKLFAYGVAPLIALLGAQFPQIAATLFRWFEPIQRLQ